jgi:transposase InsO family protein
LNGHWVAHDIRDAVVDFVTDLAQKTELPVQRLTEWLGVARGKFFDWKTRYGRVNEHNALVPRDHWLTAAEIDSILRFHAQHPLDGYRRLTYTMMDRDVVAVSPSSVYRVLRKAGVLDRWNGKPSKKGTGFVQPLKAHEHWHIDISYLNLAGTFYYLCTLLDGFSRFIVHHEIREAMKEVDVETIVQRAREKFPGLAPRIISDNGPLFIAREFQSYVRLCGMTHVRTSPYYPQSNGKIERWHKTMKSTAIRPNSPQTLPEAQALVDRFVHDYNHDRLHSAIGFITPADYLAGRAKEIWTERDRKLEAARERRRVLRQQSAPEPRAA